MGGGGAIRAVAKAAGIAVFNSCVRGRLSENSTINSGFRGRFLDTSIPNPAFVDPHATEAVDDWEFAGSEDGVFVASGDDEKSRVLFGDPPTLQEAKEATAELKEVLEKSCLSPPASPRNAILSQVSGLSCSPSLSSLRILQPTVGESEMPKHAIQALKFLSESQPLQNVVASIASDPNVWNAVLSNPALQDFLDSHQIDYSSQHQYPEEEESSIGGACDDNGDKSPGIPELSVIWKNMKIMVVDVMNELSDFFQGFLGGYHGKKVALLAGTSTGCFAKALGPSLMGLVVMVIIVVSFRRSAA